MAVAIVVFIIGAVLIGIALALIAKYEDSQKKDTRMVFGAVVLICIGSPFLFIGLPMLADHVCKMVATTKSTK